MVRIGKKPAEEPEVITDNVIYFILYDGLIERFNG
jgi:hypothetical protein